MKLSELTDESIARENGTFNNPYSAIILQRDVTIRLPYHVIYVIKLDLICMYYEFESNPIQVTGYIPAWCRPETVRQLFDYIQIVENDYED